jgi:peptidoglycan/LPS O-acetylase OafA/YrhL
VSYSLYLIHKMTIHIVQIALSNLHVNVDGTMVFLVCIVVSVAAAWILHVGVERPFMKLRSAVLASRRNTHIMGDRQIAGR